MRKLLALITLVTFISPTLRAADTPFTPTRFTVELRGQGPDILLLPGLACSRDVYQKEADLLAPHYRLHLLQINGFANSPPGPNATGPLLIPIESELHQYIQSNHLQNPFLIGHSLGGLLSLMLVADHPNDVSKIMIIDSLPFYGLLLDPKSTLESLQPQAKMMQQFLANETEAQFAQSEPAQLTQLIKSPEGLKLVTKWALASDRKVLAQAFYDDLTTDLRPKLPNIQTPITLLYPYDPTMGPQATVDTLYQSAYAPAPHAKTIRIDNSYHFIMLDQPEPFAKAVADFLKN